MEVSQTVQFKTSDNNTDRGTALEIRLINSIVSFPVLIHFSYQNMVSVFGLTARRFRNI